MEHNREHKQERPAGRRRKGQSSGIYQSLVLITQFGIEMIIPIFLCSFLGIWIDRRAGTSFWVIILFFVGALAGFTNIYKLAKRVGDRNHGSRKSGSREAGTCDAGTGGREAGKRGAGADGREIGRRGAETKDGM